MLPDIGFDVYPILIVVGFVIDFILLDIYFKKIGIQKGVSTNIQIALTISGFFGIVFAILFQNLYDFIENPSTYKWTWAMTFFGGLIGGTSVFFLIYFLFLKKKNPPFLSPLMNLAGVGVPLAHGLGRIGCFLDGCCYGKPTDSIWGIKFTTTETKVYPTNLYEAIFLLLLALIIGILVFYRVIKHSFPIYMISYGIFRFFVEFLRGDHRGSLIPNLSPSQFWAILMFVGGVIYLILILIKSRKKQQIKEN